MPVIERDIKIKQLMFCKGGDAYGSDSYVLDSPSCPWSRGDEAIEKVTKGG